jgi:hypothetical protein
MVRVNQQGPPTGTEADGSLFRPLGRFRIRSGALRVRVRNDADGFVIADAVLIAPAPSREPILLDPAPVDVGAGTKEIVCASS